MSVYEHEHEASVKSYNSEMNLELNKAYFLEVFKHTSWEYVHVLYYNILVLCFNHLYVSKTLYFTDVAIILSLR